MAIGLHETGGVWPLLLLTLAAPAPDARLAPLLDRIADDARAGRPIVVEAHVSLCDNAFVRCGGRGRGDGDDLGRNLYWATSGGFDGWFSRRGSPWKRVGTLPPGAGELTVVVWHRAVSPGPWLRRRGVARPFDLYVVAHAWRGQAIDATWAAYLADVWDRDARTWTLPSGAQLAGGGRAHVVAYLGHNRLMDEATPHRFPRERPGAPAKGVIAVACHTAPYLAPVLDAKSRVPLLLTRDFVFAGAHAFEGALAGFLDHGTLAAARAEGAAHYARGEGKPLARIDAVFTNPAHARWRW